jgi:hypothetical protein
VPATLRTARLTGMIAPKFSKTTAARTLVPSLLRGLKDGFVPVRVKALTAICVLINRGDVLQPSDCAGGILPAVAPLCCDPSGHSVREQALECVRACEKVLASNSEEVSARNNPSA